MTLHDFFSLTTFILCLLSINSSSDLPLTASWNLSLLTDWMVLKEGPEKRQSTHCGASAQSQTHTEHQPLKQTTDQNYELSLQCEFSMVGRIGWFEWCSIYADTQDGKKNNNSPLLCYLASKKIVQCSQHLAQIVKHTARLLQSVSAG